MFCVKRSPFGSPVSAKNAFQGVAYWGKGCRNDVALVWYLHDMHRYSKPPNKELGRDAECEKMWHESVRGRESGRESRLLRMWSERSEYEMRRWDGETDRETKSAIPTLSDLGCEYVDQGFRAGDTSLLFVPVFASTSKCICMLTNWSICAPPLLERFTTISIFWVVQVMTTWRKECWELIGLCRSLKRRHRPIGSALIGLPRRSDQRWSADYRRNIGRWSISKESCNISQGWMGSPS